MPEEKKHRKLPSIELTPSVSIIIAGVIIAGAIIFTNQHPAPSAATTAAAEQGTTASANVPAPSASDHIIGSPSAPIVLVEYSDFQCPYCQMIYPSIKQIVSQSNGQVAWVMREFPLYQIHPQAMPAANAAECIAAQLGSTGFFEYADAVFNNQSSLNASYSASLAKQFGANMTAYNTCITNSTYLSKIQTETSDAEASGGNGTPFTVVINTKTGKQYPISGALPQAQIQAVITQAQAGQ
ncbi:MAG TPA: thioredoxin domain-containing protein [Candidatus Paceibacterota bacterium]|nr:thioredoxin domain-containing protein [Candidatus Paceibacterota bacterium]